MATATSHWLRSIALLIVLAAPSATDAVSPGTDLLVPAVARVGAWVTDLYLFNPGDSTAAVDIHWLDRGRPNPDPRPVTVNLAPNQTSILGDVVSEVFDLDVGEGALWLTSDAPIIASCRVFARDGDATFGQSIAAVPNSWATPAGRPSHVIGLASDAAFRSNVYALAGTEGAVVRLTLLDPSGAHIASSTLHLGDREPYLRRLDRIFKTGQIGEATLLLEVESGAAVVGASRVDNTTSDPITLTSSIDHEAVSTGSLYGAVYGPAAAGGCALSVTPALEVDGLEFSYPAEGCGVLFTAGADLTGEPLSLADLASGYEFSSDYPAGGTMAWRLRLEQGPGGATLTGNLAATGSGWTGDLAACNGVQPVLDVVVGRQRR